MCTVIRIYIQIYIYTHTHICTHIYIYVHMYMCMYISIYIYAHIYMHIYRFLYICIYIHLVRITLNFIRTFFSERFARIFSTIQCWTTLNIHQSIYFLSYTIHEHQCVAGWDNRNDISMITHAY